MSELSKKGPVQGVSRRGFVGAGLMVGGALASDVAIAGAKEVSASADAAAGEIPPALGHINHLSYVCADCRICEIVCTLSHRGKIQPTLARNIVVRNVQAGDVTHVLYCQQCDDPKCLKACPTGALHVDEVTGARVIDDTVCIGCQSCLNACIYAQGEQGQSRIKYDPETNTCFKCDLCGGEPKCVQYCPIGASQSSWITYRDIIRPGIDDYVAPESDGGSLQDVTFSREIGGQQAAKLHEASPWTLSTTDTGVAAVCRIGSSDGGALRVTIHAEFKDADGNVLGTSAEIRRLLRMHDEKDVELTCDGVDADSVAQVTIAGDVTYWVDGVDEEY
jgi:Fe-S-cluster-containing dehydrogenase component